MQIMRHLGHIVGGTLLITATTVGVGMLGLPVVTGAMGFGPALILYFLAWLFMLSTGLLMLEVCTWMPKDANFITMTEKLLGSAGKWFCWIVYLFLFVTIMIAHVAGAGNMLAELTGGKLPLWLAIVGYVAIFSPFIYFGTRTIDRVNLILMVGVVIAFLSFVFLSAEHVNFNLLKHSDWSKAWIAIPVLLTAFTYQLIIPTLMTYMDRNVKKVRLAIIIGSAIPLVVYLVWEALILGIIPVYGEQGLIAAAAQGFTAVMPLKHYLGDGRVFQIGNWFSFFVFTTSYLAFSLAFFDFLADGLRVKKTGMGKLILCLLIFVPPTIISLFNPKVFLVMLEYAGGISCAILFGLFPPLMAWIGRYIQKRPHQERQVIGGKPMLSVLIGFIVVEVVFKLATFVL